MSAPDQPETIGGRFGLAALLLLIAALTLYRYWVLSGHGFPLYVDEAYYWTWAQMLDWGYFSKPPMIAGIIALTTELCGDAEPCVRIAALLIHPVTALVIYALGRRLFDSPVGFWAATAYLTLPAVSLSSLIISTDVPLLLFWSLALYAQWRAFESGHGGWWLAAGLALGLGMMSKYNMVLFGLFSLIFLLGSAQHRGWWWDWRPWAAAALALLVLAPNLWWNLVHDFPTFRHTAEISHLDQGRLHFGELLGFFFAQFGVFGPVLFAVLLGIGRHARQLWDQPRYRFLLLFSLPFLAFICVQALLGRAHANWAAPTYVGAVLLVTGWLHQQGRQRLLIAGIVLNLLIGLGLYHFEQITDQAGITLTKRTDPLRRLRGWRELGQEMAAYGAGDPNRVFLSDSRTLLSHLAYQLRLPQEQLKSWNPNGDVRHQFDITQGLTPKPGADYVLVTEVRRSPAYFSRFFQQVSEPQSLEIPVLPDLNRRFWVYRLKGFRGYGSP